MSEMIGRSGEIINALEMLSIEFDRINLIKTLPVDVDPGRFEDLQSAALGLLSSILMYLRVAHIYFKNSFQSKITSQSHTDDLENLIHNVFKGSAVFDEAVKRVQLAVMRYNTALSDYGLILMATNAGLGRKIHQLVEDMSDKLEGMSLYEDNFQTMLKNELGDFRYATYVGDATNRQRSWGW